MIGYEKKCKTLTNLCSGRSPIRRSGGRVLRHLRVTHEDIGKRERQNRERTIEQLLAIFHGSGVGGDNTANSPGTKWTAFNAIAEHLVKVAAT